VPAKGGTKRGRNECYSPRMDRTARRAAGWCGFLGVACGAFGAHAFKARLAETGYAAQYETATLYHLVHAVALGVVAAIDLGPKARRAAVVAFVIGIVLFSGSLYALALSGVKVFGAVTPLGGVAFLAGWSILAFAQRGGRTAAP
jgi:uncharacterized membrane protein YgdD (TMEM256/DUF423 family)